MNCPNCGAPVSNEDKFCIKCGFRLTATKSFCKSCGTELTPGTKFCPKCGQPVSSENSPTQIQQNNTNENTGFKPVPGVSASIEPPRKRKGKIILFIVLGILFLGIIRACLGGNGDKEEAKSTEETTEASTEVVTEDSSVFESETVESTSEETSTMVTTTEAPTTEELTTEAPTTEEITTVEPTTEEPTTKEPTTEEPTTPEPTTEPTTPEPTTETPTTPAPTTEPPTTQAKTIPPVTTQGLTYTTNDKSGAKAGSTGLFAYEGKERGQYAIYVVIDFDHSYVYFFTEGNGSTTVDRAPITSGNLNDGLFVKYTVGNDSWIENFHFKWANMPDTLVHVLDGDAIEYIPTSLSHCIDIINSRTVIDY